MTLGRLDEGWLAIFRFFWGGEMGFIYANMPSICNIMPDILSMVRWI
jgi:hypothetical protein